MSYNYDIERLLDLLHKGAPAKTNELARRRQRVDNGLLSVGLKLHCLDGGKQFSDLIEDLGGRRQILEINHYRRDTFRAICWVLPPVGNAHAAELLLEAIEEATTSKIFDNPYIQIQVCSPGRLGATRSALLSIGFYLGSDTVRQYTLADLATTFSNNSVIPRAKRLVLYDAGGDFEQNFAWWVRTGTYAEVLPRLPFESGRTDVLTATSKHDVNNINLLATLLVHAEHHGYWSPLGMQFEEEMVAMLERHQLKHLLSAPWIRTDDVSSGDDKLYLESLRELMAYAAEDVVRIEKKRGLFWDRSKHPNGILAETKEIINRCRTEVTTKSPATYKGGTR